VPAKPILARAGNVCNGELQENVPSDELSREREREEDSRDVRQLEAISGTLGCAKLIGETYVSQPLDLQREPLMLRFGCKGLQTNARRGEETITFTCDYTANAGSFRLQLVGNAFGDASSMQARTNRHTIQ